MNAHETLRYLIDQFSWRNNPIPKYVLLLITLTLSITESIIFILINRCFKISSYKVPNNIQYFFQNPGDVFKLSVLLSLSFHYYLIILDRKKSKYEHSEVLSNIFFSTHLKTSISSEFVGSTLSYYILFYPFDISTYYFGIP